MLQSLSRVPSLGWLVPGNVTLVHVNPRFQSESEAIYDLYVIYIVLIVGMHFGAG
jgi:hypothetical protein